VHVHECIYLYMSVQYMYNIDNIYISINTYICTYEHARKTELTENGNFRLCILCIHILCVCARVYIYLYTRTYIYI
jgi:hypothetical protein